MHKLKILVAEDMAHEQLVIEANLRQELPENVDPIFTFVDNAEAAVERAKSVQFDLAILDIDFSQSEASKGMTGLEAAKMIRKLRSDMFLVIVSSDEQETTMISAIDQFGVDRYLRRSSISYEELGWVSKQAILSRLHRENSLVEARYHFQTQNSSAIRLLRKVDSVRECQNTFIYGETGTGKELIARRIHANARAFEPKRPLKVLDCSAITPQLFESEVFGHKRGAFTGAANDRIGALQLANGGDLFLDEIHNIPIDLQQKLLRVLNDGVFSPVGSNEEIRSKFRVIAATNIPVEEAIREKRLLPDFVERLRKIKIDLPALRNRADDIPLLVKSYLSSVGSFDKEFSKDALHAMMDFPWKGNIRELRGFIDTVISEVKIPIVSIVHLNELTQGQQSKDSALGKTAAESDIISNFAVRMLEAEMPLSDLIAKVESTYVRKTLIEAGNLRGAAKALGLSTSALHRKLKALRIEA